MLAYHWSSPKNRKPTRDHLFDVGPHQQTCGLFEDEEPELGYDSGGRLFKPRGLWFSPVGAENSWEDWCRGEDFNIEGLAHRHVLDLDETNLKMITSVAELDHFSIEYGRDAWGPDNDKSFVYWMINWRRLQREGYKGIVISPYQWSRRLDMGRGHGCVSDWYYPWDCASGCVWDSSAIRSVECDTAAKI